MKKEKNDRVSMMSSTFHLDFVRMAKLTESGQNLVALTVSQLTHQRSNWQWVETQRGSALFNCFRKED